jgi:pimeloyl-ACP methyl ester carboxylesterase
MTLRTALSVEVLGRELAVERLEPDGGGKGPVLVFLHEGLGCIALWRDVPARCCERLGFPAIVYDRQGHGRSDPPDGPRTMRYLHEEAEEQLPALLDALGIADAVLIGHSDGGTIALLFAASFPKRVKALVTLAAHVFVEGITIDGIEATVRAYAAGGLGARLERHHGEGTDALFHAWADTWLAPWFRQWNVEDCLPRVTAPVLIMQGVDDRYGTPRQIKAIARGLAGPHRTLLLPGVGHAPHLEAPDTVVEAVASFVSASLAAGEA